MLEANPGIDDFRVERDGDEVTLVFTRDAGTFRWIGTKHDFYRLSMGVRVAETFDRLCRADPNIEAGGVEDDGNPFVFRVRFPGAGPAAGSGEKRPPVTAARPAQPPVPAGPPPGVEAEVGAGATGGARPAPVVVESLPTAPPADGQPPAQARPDGARAAWERARSDDTLKAYARFLDRYPDAPEAPRARERAAALREDRAYRRARSEDDAAVYRAFLEQFPGSAHRVEIEGRLRAAEERRRRAEAERRAGEAAAARRRSAYDKARDLDTPDAYRVFLATYPDTPEARRARKRLAAIEADDEAFRAARGNEGALQAYLATRPNGRHARQARAEIQGLRRTRMEAAFSAARRAGTRDALEAFLAAWPDGPRAREVRAALAVMDDTRPPNHAPVDVDGPVLGAPAVPVAPVLDGRLDDPAWERAEPVTVALAGDGGEKTLEVRAVHTDREVFLAARWADPTRDVRHRPWVWDEGAGTYRQSEALDDGFAVAIHPGSGPGRSCMLAGGPVDADLWLWRAEWSALSGLARDGRLQVSRSRLPRSNPYPARDGSGQVWIREVPDRGSSGWSFFIPVEFRKPVVDAYRAAPAAGSRSDVQAVGLWSGGVWTVEFSRALDTGHEDDVALAAGQDRAVSFSAFDRADKARHAVTELVRLVLEAGKGRR